MTEVTNNSPAQQVPSWVPTAPPAAPNAPAAPAAEVGKKDSRPSTLVLAGAGSLLAVLAFLGGTAVGHAWGSSGSGQTQFNGPGGGFRQFPQQGQGQGQGQLPQQGQGQDQGQVPQQGQGQTQPGQTQTS